MEEKNEQNVKDNKFIGWFCLVFGLLLLVDGIIKIIFNITWTGWSYLAQQETYNNGWYFSFIGFALSIGAFLNLRNSYSKKR